MLNDNEIIKGLERCCDASGIQLIKATLDLINRQIAENTELQRKNAELQQEIRSCIAKAIKEFAERLCEGRVSNDPVVIAVKVELEELTVNYESSKQRKENENGKATM